MKPLFLLGLCMVSGLAFAGDKIGNGGGTWTCRAAEFAPFTQAMLVDFFEAREQHGWNLRPAPAGASAFVFADMMMLEIERDFPSYGPLWRNALARTKAAFTPVRAALEVVDDALFQIRPEPSACPNGQWFYTQFANFNPQGQVLVSRELWESPLLSEGEKAGLIWHEAVYLWLRETHADVDSVRARVITGLLFSQLSTQEKTAKLAGIMNAVLPDRQDWFCRITNQLSMAVFGAYGATEMEARVSALSTCKAGQYGFHCDEPGMRCEKIETGTIAWSCASENALNGKLFIGRGRVQTEAEFRSIEACQAATMKRDWRQCVIRPAGCSQL